MTAGREETGRILPPPQCSNLKYYTLIINADLWDGFRQEAFNLA